MTDLTQANMIAAKLLGVEQASYGSGMYLIDIEDDATRMHVVEAMGEKHGYDIRVFFKQFEDDTWSNGWAYTDEYDNWSVGYETYTEAVAAALLALGENDE